MKYMLPRLMTASLFWFLIPMSGTARAQQFNSDNYLSKPHGVATIILTAGERNTMWMTTFSLFPNWEFTAAAYLYDKDNDRTTEDGYSTSYYAKWMLYENAAEDGRLCGQGRNRSGPGLRVGLRIGGRLPDLLDERARDGAVLRQQGVLGHHAGRERDSELWRR